MPTTLNSVALYPTAIQKIVKSTRGQRDLCDFTSEVMSHPFLCHHLLVRLLEAWLTGTVQGLSTGVDGWLTSDGYVIFSLQSHASPVYSWLLFGCRPEFLPAPPRSHIASWSSSNICCGATCSFQCRCDNKPPGSQHGPKGDLGSKLELLSSWPCPTTLLAVLVGPYWHGASPQESPTESQTGSRKSHSPFNLPVSSHCPHQESNMGNCNTLLLSFLILSLCLSPQSHN